VIVHHLVTGGGIFLVNIREGKAVPEMRPGLGARLVHVAVIGHIILAGVGFGARSEFLAVLKLIVLDLDDVRGVLARTEPVHNMFRQQVLGFLTVGFVELVARLQIGGRRVGKSHETRGGQSS